MANEQIAVSLQPPSGQVGWQMKVGSGGWKTGPQYDEIDVPNGKKADITFTIQNGAGQTVKFAADPILVAVKDKVFDNPVVATDGLSFKITDKNPKQEQIPYALVFTGAPKLDPIIDNGGGNKAWFEYSTPQWIEIGVGLLLALVVGMLLQKKFKLFG